jgi:hypothetical protein
MTEKGDPCKNSIKVEDTKVGHQKLTTLAREPFDLSTLQSKVCDVARDFLCARWHRQRQADLLGQQWYEAAVHNQERVSHSSRVASPSVVVRPGQRQTSSASRRRPAASDNTDRSPNGPRQDPLVSTNPEPVQPFNPYVTSTMLRTNSVPWRVSLARPAILSSATNIWAGVQDLTLQTLTPSEEVDSIHCVFCLTDDEDHANERGISGALGERLPRRRMLSLGGKWHIIHHEVRCAGLDTHAVRVCVFDAWFPSSSEEARAAEAGVERDTSGWSLPSLPVAVVAGAGGVPECFRKDCLLNGGTIVPG